jgi:hypothetical protein
MFDVYMIERDALIVCRPKGILDASEALQIVEFVEVKEKEMESGFDRFVDLTQLESIRLSAAEVAALADRRRTFKPNDIRVKSAFVATHPLSYGIARMYEQMLNSDRIEVQVFCELEEAAAWLLVKPQKLKL